MLRRTLAAVWFAGGIVLMVFVMRFANLPPRELLALTALLVGGLAASFIAIVARDIPLRSWVRNTACLIGGILLAGVLYLWYHVEAEVLPAVPDANIAFRQRMEAGVELLSWLSICVAYAAFAYATLPASGGSAGAIGVKGRSVRGPGRLPAGGGDLSDAAATPVAPGNTEQTCEDEGSSLKE